MTKTPTPGHRPMADLEMPEKPQKAKGTSGNPSDLTREEKLAKQLRDNLARRKQQSRARNTRPRKFKNNTD
jgi:hypothetical protein